MTQKQIQAKLDTYKKLLSILSASKIKVIQEIKKIKTKSSFNYDVVLIMISIFEKLKKDHGYNSKILSGDSEKPKINVVMLEKKMTLSNSRNSVIRKYNQQVKEGDKNLIIVHDNDEYVANDNETIVKRRNISGISSLINNLYLSDNYSEVVVYSSTNKDITNTILPIDKHIHNDSNKRNSIIKANVNVMPSVDEVVESTFDKYMISMLKYYDFYGLQHDLKNTLVKHESSIKHVEEKIEEYNMKLNKLRQEKITNEIISGGEND